MRTGFGRSGDLPVAVNIDISAIDNACKKSAPRTQPKPCRAGRDDAFLDVTSEVVIDPAANLRSNPRLLISRLDQFSLLMVAMALSAGVLLHLVFGNWSGEPPPQLTAYRVDLNTAELEELVLLEGVGELTAEKIMLDRQKKGFFLAEDDLQRVKGIGPKTMERLRDHIVCR